MPRFPDSSVACLKRTMLACASRDFRFNAYDVEVITKETGLNQAQIQVWADHFRMRYETQKDRMEFLETDALDKPEKSTKNSRYFVTCFNVGPEFFTAFKFSKSNGNGVFGIKYMEAAFNKEAESGEFFVEFDEYVWEHKLIESFNAQGAGQVMTVTFTNNDGGESATNALLRILSKQTKTGIACSRGTCPPALLAKVQAKQAAARVAVSTSKEFDEKTLAAIKQSMAEHKEVMVKLEGGLQSQVVKLEGIESGVQSQVVKLEGIESGVQSQVVKIEDIQNGMCNVIPDYQNEIAKLKEALAKKTAACDTIEGKLAHKTRIINQQDAYITNLLKIHKLDVAEKQEMTRETVDLINQNAVLKGQLNMSTYLKQILDQTQHTAEILSSTLEEERASKRQRHF